MEELIIKLNNIPNSYFGFVAGITAYAKKKPERLEKVMQYINTTENLTTADVVRFVMLQPDFHEGVSGLTITLPHFSSCIAMRTISLTTHTRQPTPPERFPFHASRSMGAVLRIDKYVPHPNDRIS